MMTIGDTLKAARDELGLSQEELAVKIRSLTGQGFSRAALALIETGSTKNPKPHNLQAACDALNIDFRNALKGKIVWLNKGQITATLNGVGGVMHGQINPPISANATPLGSFDLWDDETPLRDDEVALNFFREVELAAGAGRTEVIENHGRKLRFSKATLKRQGIQAAHAACVTVSGNSMEPVLPDGCTIGIDTGNTEIKNGELYALDHDGHLRIKMLYRMPGDVIRLRSFNSDEWPDEHYSGDAAAKIRIIGRVFWWSVLR